MKKIGFIDYYISEWHANNYPVWIKEISAELGLEFEVSYAYAELEVSPVDQVTTDEWCAKMGVERCFSIAELCEKSDFICILAPSNPEKHLGLCREAFKCGKRTYVDKTFAPDLATAKEIFALGEKYSTEFFSTSALRYADELSELAEPKALTVTGTGSNFEEYFIHIAEICVKLMGTDISAVSALPVGKEQTAVKVEFFSGRSASLVFAPGMPYSVCGECEKNVYKRLESKYFMVLMKEMLLFFDGGKLPFKGEETLAVARLREAAISSRNAGGGRIVF